MSGVLVCGDRRFSTLGASPEQASFAADLRLVPWVDCDPDAFVERYVVNHAALVLAGVTRPGIITPQQARNEFNSLQREISQGDAVGYGAHRGARFIGAVVVTGLGEEEFEPELEYWVDKEECGNGIATVATRRVMDHVFATTDIDDVGLDIRRGNVPSQKVATKLGARRTSVSRGTFEVWRLRRGPH